MREFIPLSVPNFSGNELKYVSEAVASTWVSTGGSYITKFEQEMAKYLKVPQVVACQSGTAGLHLALQTAGVTRNDAVIVPTLTFIAAVNPVRYLGAEPIFMDCDRSLNMDVEKMEQFLQEECFIKEEALWHKATGKRIPALVIVHVFGNLAQIEKIVQLAKDHHLLVVEDATEALGTYQTEGPMAGTFAGTFGDYGVYSFNGNKIITTGGGGAVVAKDPEKLEFLRYLSTQAKDDELYYIHHHVGYNYRMTNLQAALGVAQLEQLEGFIEVKINNYQQYKKNIDNIPGLSILGFRQDTRSNHWLYSLEIDSSAYNMDRDQLLRYLEENKIQTRPIWGLIHHQQPYQNNIAYKIEQAEEMYQVILNIPCSSNLLVEQVEDICQVLANAGK